MPMPNCQQCGGHISQDFARVFGDNNDDVHACHGCTVQQDLKYRANGRTRPSNTQTTAVPIPDGGHQEGER